IDFTLAGWQNKNAYLINDLSLISGGVNYTITVDSDQRSGQWKLAGNAADFTKTLTVRDTYGNIYGTITVNKESFEYDSRSYTLTVSNGDLILTISEPSDPRVNIYSSGVLVSSGTYISGIVLSSYLDSAAVSSMGVLESATVSSGAYVQILSGGSIVDATVTDGGRLYVSGKAENLQVLSRGDVRVFSGLALDTEVFAGGSFGVEYGSAVDTVIYSGAAVWLTPYGEYQNTLLHSGGCLQYNGNVVTVLNGESGTIGGVTIDSGSYYSTLRFSGESENLVISAGSVVLLENAFLKNVSVDADLSLGSGARVSELLLEHGGLSLYYSTFADHVTVGSYGTVRLWSPDAVLSAVEILSSGRVEVEEGTIMDTVISSGGMLMVASGSAVNTTLYDDGVLSFSNQYYNSGIIKAIQPEVSGVVGGVGNSSSYASLIGKTSQVVLSGNVEFRLDGDAVLKDALLYGYVTASGSGAMVQDLVVSSGTLALGEQAVASSVDLAGSMTALKLYDSAAVLDEARISSGARLSVNAGRAGNIEIFNGGSAYVSSAAVVNGITLHSGGELQYGYSSTTSFFATDQTPAVIGGFTVDQYGSWTLTGETRDVIVNGSLTLSDGAVLKNAVLDDGAVFYSGAYGENLTVQHGTLQLDSGTSANSVTIGISNEYSYGHLEIRSSAAVSNTVVHNNGNMHVDGGSAENTVISSGGRMFLNGTAVNTFIDAGGSMVFDRGAASNTTLLSDGVLKSGYLQIYALSGQEGFIENIQSNYSSGGVSFSLSGKAENLFVSGGVLYLSDKAVLKNAVLVDGAVFYSGAYGENLTVQHGTLQLDSGTSANSVTIGISNEYSNGHLEIRSSAAVSNTVVHNTGKMYVDGGSAENTVVSSGGCMFLHDETARVVNTLVDAGGSMQLYNGSVSDTTLSLYGTLAISSSVVITAFGKAGYIENLSISSGSSAAFAGRAENLAVSGRINLSENVVLKNVVLHNGATFSNGAAGENIRVSNGDLWLRDASLNSAVLNENSYLRLEGSSASAAHVMIGESGQMNVYDGIAENTTVHSGGNLTVFSGAVHRGSLYMENGANVMISSGGILDWNIRDYTPEYSALINDLSLVGGTPTYTITVSGDQKTGTYILADGAESFSATVSLVNESEVLGAISVNGTLAADGRDYTLTLNNDGELLLDISVTETVPQKSNVSLVSSGIVISSGHNLSDLLVQNYTSMLVSSGAVVEGTTLSQGGCMIVSGGAAAEQTLLLPGGILSAVPDGKVYDTTISSGGKLMFGDISFAARQLVGHLGGLETSSSVYLLGSNSGLSVRGMGARIGMGSGAVLNYTDLETISLILSGNGTVSNVRVKENAVVRLYAPNAVGKNLTVLNNGAVSAFYGGEISSAIVFEYGTLHVGSSGKAEDVTLGGSNTLFNLHGNGVANRTTVTSYGFMSVTEGAEATSTFINSYGSMTVERAKIEDTMIGSGGSVMLNDSAVASRTTVSNMGYLSLGEGAEARQTVISSGGRMFFNGRNSMTDLVIYSGAKVSGNGLQFTVWGSNPALIGKLSSENDLSLGGTIENLFISRAVSPVNIREYAKLNHIQLASARLVMPSMGMASDVVLLQNAGLTACSSSILKDVTVSSGTFSLEGPGVIASNTILAGLYEGSGSSYMRIAGASAVNTEVNMSAGMLMINGIAHGVTVNDGGHVQLNNGILEELVLNAGAVVMVSNGSVSNAFIHSGASFTIYNSNAELSFDNIIVYEGGTLSLNGNAETPILTAVAGHSGLIEGEFSNGGFVNGSLSNLLLLSSQRLDVGSGTVADGIQLERLAHLMIHSGGTVLNTELSAGMSATVYSSGVLSGVALNDRGSLILSAGARVYDLDYYSNTSTSLRITGAYVTVSGMTIHSGGKAVFNNNSFRAENVTLKVGGCLGGFSFDEEQHIDVVSRGSATLSSNVFIINNSLQVQHSGSIRGVITDSSGMMPNIQVSSGGTIRDVTMNSGKMTLSGRLTGTLTVTADSQVNVLDGEVNFDLTDRTGNDTYLINDLSRITGTPVFTITVTADQASGEYKLAQGASSPDYTITIGDKNGSYGTFTTGSALLYNEKQYRLVNEDGMLQLRIDHMIPEVQLYSSGALVSSLATVSGITLLSREYDSMVVIHGGTAYATTLYEYTQMYVSAGGSAENTQVNDYGELNVLDGGIISGTTVNQSGTVRISGGGVANNLEIADRGWGFLFSDGRINDLRNGGSMTLLGGVLSSATVSGSFGYIHVDGGYAEQITVKEEGSLFVGDGGTVENVTADLDGTVKVSSGGNGSNILISSGGAVLVARGGNVSGLTVFLGGVLGAFTFEKDLYFSEITNGSAVLSNNVYIVANEMHVLSGGIASNTVIHDGYLRISSGGIHRGTLMITSDHSVYADGGVIDFTLTDRKVTDDYLINDLSRITGTPVFTITVTADQAYGEYKLAQGAFCITDNDLVTIGDGTTAYGVLTVDLNQVEYGKNLYSLVKSDDNLHLVITEKKPTVFLYSSGTLVSSGYSAADMTLVSGTIDSMCISSGGIASNTTVNAGGRMAIDNHGAANEIQINSGGSVFITRFASATDVTVAKNGSLIMEGTYAAVSDITVYGYLEAGGESIVSNAEIYGTGAMYSGTVNHLTVHDGASFVFGQNTAYSCNNHLNGTVTVSGQLWIAYYTYGSREIYLDLTERTTEDAVLLRELDNLRGNTDFTINILEDQGYGAYLLADGVTQDDIVMTLEDDVLMSDTLSVNGEALYYNDKSYSLKLEESSLFLHIADAAPRVKVYSSGALISAAPAMSGIDLTGGEMYDTMYISSGGVADDIAIHSGGSAMIFADGLMNSVEVNSDGVLHISSGGYAGTVHISGGDFSLANGAVVDHLYITNGDQIAWADSGSIGSLTLASEFDINIKENKSLQNLTVLDGAYSWVRGDVDHVHVGANGFVRIEDKSIIDTVHISSGGHLYYSKKQLDSEITVDHGGVLIIQGNIIANEDITLAGFLGSQLVSGSLNMNGHTLTLDITGAYTDDYSFIEDLSLLSNVNYQVKVSATQASGKYYLADQAGMFDNSLTIVCGGDTYSVKSGETVTIGDAEYSLSLEPWLDYYNRENMRLVLSVDNEAGVAPEIPEYQPGTYLNSLREALAAAEKQNKMIMALNIDIAGCSVSKQYYNEILSTDEFKSFAEDNLILLHVQDERVTYPGTYMLNADGNEMYREIGYNTTEGLPVWMTYLELTCGLKSGVWTKDADGYRWIADGTEITDLSVTGDTLLYAGNTTLVNGMIGSGVKAEIFNADLSATTIAGSATLYHTIGENLKNNGRMTVWSGSIINSATLNSNSYAYVNSSGKMLNATVQKSARMTVRMGGTASGTLVNGGVLYLDSAGFVEDTRVVNSGIFNIFSGGMAKDTTNGGTMYISS
ncbi:MAG: AIDA repeat-containing protein, partial [Lentisphaeria bacterium]|nr:AIDA repeat-containing protein [Lentisphaeria bacterium]